MYRLERVYKTRSTPGDCTTTHIHNTHQIYVLAQIDIIFLSTFIPRCRNNVMLQLFLLNEAQIERVRVGTNGVQ